MSVKSAQACTVLFSTSDAASGAATDADDTPVGTLYVDGTADAAAVTVTKIDDGLYKAALTLPALTAGQLVALRVAAEVDSIAAEGVVWQDVADTVRASDLATAANLATVDGIVDAILEDTGTTLDDKLDAIAAKTALLGTGTISVVAQTTTDGTWLPLIAGDDYVAGRSSELSVTTDLDLAVLGEAGVYLNLGKALTGIECTVEGPDDDGAYKVTVPHLTAAQTTGLYGIYQREFEALDADGFKTTFGRASVTVERD